MNKKMIRSNFRSSVFKRDKYCCKCCGKQGKDRQGGEDWKKFHKSVDPCDLDAHHIVSRDLMPNGGYVTSNGVSVCDSCHLKCEKFWETGEALPGFAIEDLFKLIGSSEEKARKDSEKINN